MQRYTQIPETSIIVFSLIVLLRLGVGNAADLQEISAKDGSADKPVLVVFLVAEDADDRTREQRFVTQLRLAFDDFDIKPVELSIEKYTSLPLYRKLTLVREHSDQLNAVATTWLENAGAETVMLHMAALSTGCAFVRIVEAHNSPTAEEELAFAVQELIGQVYMLSPPHGNPPVERAVEAVLEEAVSLREPHADLGWAVMPFLRVSGGIWGHKGQWFRFGGGISLEARVAEHFHLRASLAGLAGPFHEPHDGVVRGWGLMPGFHFGFDWPAGFLRIGPVVGASLVRSIFFTTMGTGDSQTYSWWDFRGSLGIDLSWSLKKVVSIVATPSVGVWTNQRTFVRISDDSNIISSPLVDWSCTLGLSISI